MGGRHDARFAALACRGGLARRGCGALAQAAADYPNQTVRIVVPFSAGSITDGLARVLADKLAELWKQQVIVENRPGIAGTASVAKSAPDGYTLMLTSNGHTIAAVVNKNLPFDPAKDFTGVTQVALVPQALIVPPNLPAKNVVGVDRAGARQAGEMNFSSAGLASTSYLGAEMLKQTAKINIVHVPHKGAPEAITSVMRGDSSCSSSASISRPSCTRPARCGRSRLRQGQAQPGVAGRADRRRSPACPNTSTTPGSACWRRRARRSRSSTRSARTSRACCRCRRWPSA